MFCASIIHQMPFEITSPKNIWIDDGADCHCQSLAVNTVGCGIPTTMFIALHRVVIVITANNCRMNLHAAPRPTLKKFKSKKWDRNAYACILHSVVFSCSIFYCCCENCSVELGCTSTCCCPTMTRNSTASSKMCKLLMNSIVACFSIIWIWICFCLWKTMNEWECVI